TCAFAKQRVQYARRSHSRHPCKSPQVRFRIARPSALRLHASRTPSSALPTETVSWVHGRISPLASTWTLPLQALHTPESSVLFPLRWYESVFNRGFLRARRYLASSMRRPSGDRSPSSRG